MNGLTRLRSQIEKVDGKILRLLNDRLALSTEIGREKRRQGTGFFAPEREETLLALLEQRNPGRLPASSLRAIYREIFSSSRGEQRPLTVGYLGASVSSALLASQARFGAGEGYRPYSTWAALLKDLRAAKIDAAVVPGAAVVRALAATPAAKALGPDLSLCGEVILPGAGRTKPEAFFLLAPCGDATEKAAAHPGWKRVFQLAPAGRPAPAALARWCRAQRCVSLSPRLVTALGASPTALEASLRKAFGPASRLHLLGAFAPSPHGR